MGRVMEEVEQEFGLPFWEVVQGFADDGYSATATAELLGYAGPTSFLRLLGRHGKRELFRKGQDTAFALDARASRVGKCSEAMRAACRRASAANPCYRRIEWQGVTDTIAGHARRLGINPRTAYKRSYRRPGDWEYIFATTYRYTPPPRGKGWQAFDFTIGRRAA